MCAVTIFAAVQSPYIAVGRHEAGERTRMNAPVGSGGWLGRLRQDPAAALSEAVGAAFRRLSANDPAVAGSFSRLDGRILAVEIRGGGPRVMLRFHSTHAEVLGEQSAQFDVRICGSIADFIAYARASRRGESAGAGRIEISGDLQTAQDVQTLIGAIDLDIEEILARYIGGVAAHQIGRALHAVTDYGRNAVSRLEQDLSDYVRVEAGVLPTRREVDDQRRAAFELADDLARLEARLRRLEDVAP